jgi:cell cycle checkpoint protein
MDPDSGDEARPAEETHREAAPAEPEAWSLPLSQNSGSDLPASQPQPLSSKVDMEEEDMIIEDYDSDGT